MPSGFLPRKGFFSVLRLRTILQITSTALFLVGAAGPTPVSAAPLASTHLPPGTPYFQATVVNIVDTSKAAWSPSAPDPSGIDFWPLTGRFLIVDSEVDEMPDNFTGVNVFDADTSGKLISTCSTTDANRGGWSNEPTGLGINPANNRLYISDDDQNKVFEVSLGPDGAYCTADDLVTSASFATDTEDVAYGDNKLFIAGGTTGKVIWFDLGADGVLGGGDDGPITIWDAASLGFHDLEGIDYNPENKTLFLLSTQPNEQYLGEATTDGHLLRAWDLSFMGSMPNMRSDVAYAPSSADPAMKNIYIVSRGLDNNPHTDENDGRWWEVRRGTNPVPPAPSNDGLSSAALIRDIPFTDSRETAGAAQAPSDPPFTGCSDAAGLVSVWYRYTPSSNGKIYLDTLGSDYDTMLGVWTGRPGNLVEAACNDNTGSGVQSQLSLGMTAGTTYYISVSQPGPLGQVGGKLVLHVTPWQDEPRSRMFWRFIECLFSDKNGCGAEW